MHTYSSVLTGGSLYTPGQKLGVQQSVNSHNILVHCEFCIFQRGNRVAACLELIILVEIG